ncbi:hypothetical protein JCM10213_006290 [Rhodosporidiobolus nylandii]
MPTKAARSPTDERAFHGPSKAERARTLLEAAAPAGSGAYPLRQRTARTRKPMVDAFSDDEVMDELEQQSADDEGEVVLAPSPKRAKAKAASPSTTTAAGKPRRASVSKKKTVSASPAPPTPAAVAAEAVLDSLPPSSRLRSRRDSTLSTKSHGSDSSLTSLDELDSEYEGGKAVNPSDKSMAGQPGYSPKGKKLGRPPGPGKKLGPRKPSDVAGKGVKGANGTKAPAKKPATRSGKKPAAGLATASKAPGKAQQLALAMGATEEAASAAVPATSNDLYLAADSSSEPEDPDDDEFDPSHPTAGSPVASNASTGRRTRAAATKGKSPAKGQGRRGSTASATGGGGGRRTSIERCAGVEALARKRRADAEAEDAARAAGAPLPAPVPSPRPPSGPRLIRIDTDFKPPSMPLVQALFEKRKEVLQEMRIEAGKDAQLQKRSEEQIESALHSLEEGARQTALCLAMNRYTSFCALPQVDIPPFPITNAKLALFLARVPCTAVSSALLHAFPQPKQYHIPLAGYVTHPSLTADEGDRVTRELMHAWIEALGFAQMSVRDIWWEVLDPAGWARKQREGEDFTALTTVFSSSSQDDPVRPQHPALKSVTGDMLLKEVLAAIEPRDSIDAWWAKQARAGVFPFSQLAANGVAQGKGKERAKDSEESDGPDKKRTKWMKGGKAVNGPKPGIRSSSSTSTLSAQARVNGFDPAASDGMPALTYDALTTTPQGSGAPSASSSVNGGNANATRGVSQPGPSFPAVSNPIGPHDYTQLGGDGAPPSTAGPSQLALPHPPRGPPARQPGFAFGGASAPLAAYSAQPDELPDPFHPVAQGRRRSVAFVDEQYPQYAGPSRQPSYEGEQKWVAEQGYRMHAGATAEYTYGYPPFSQQQQHSPIHRRPPRQRSYDPYHAYPPQYPAEVYDAPPFSPHGGYTTLAPHRSRPTSAFDRYGSDLLPPPSQDADMRARQETMPGGAAAVASGAPAEREPVQQVPPRVLESAPFGAAQPDQSNGKQPPLAAEGHDSASFTQATTGPIDAVELVAALEAQQLLELAQTEPMEDVQQTEPAGLQASSGAVQQDAAGGGNAPGEAVVLAQQQPSNDDEKVQQPQDAPSTAAVAARSSEATFAPTFAASPAPVAQPQQPDVATPASTVGTAMLPPPIPVANGVTQRSRAVSSATPHPLPQQNFRPHLRQFSAPVYQIQSGAPHPVHTEYELPPDDYAAFGYSSSPFASRPARPAPPHHAYSSPAHYSYPSSGLGGYHAAAGADFAQLPTPPSTMPRRFPPPTGYPSPRPLAHHEQGYERPVVYGHPPPHSQYALPPGARVGWPAYAAASPPERASFPQYTSDSGAAAAYPTPGTPSTAQFAGQQAAIQRSARELPAHDFEEAAQGYAISQGGAADVGLGIELA